MKTGLTIQQMAQELLRQSKAKQDYLVNTGSLSLSVTSDAPQLRVTENGLDKIAPLDIRQTAHRQLGTYLGIPQKYYELMRTDAPELLAYPNTPAIKVQLLPVNAGERITMTQNLGQPLPRYQAFLCDGMLEVDSTAFMDYMEENDLGYIVDYKRYDADVFTGVNRRTAAVFQFHSAALRRLNKVGCQRYEGDYTRLKQKHAERRARRMAG